MIESGLCHYEPGGTVPFRDSRLIEDAERPCLASPMTFPSKQELRRLWFTVHKWLGLTLALPVLLIFLSGSLLVVKNWLGASTAEGPMRVVHVLHGSLLLGRPGARTAGGVAFLLLLSALSGLWLWWPMKGPLLRATRWQRTPSTNANIHHQAGYWLALPLVILAVTGASISFHGAFSKATGEEMPRLMRRIHDGTGMPLAWQIVIFVSGLLGATMAVTGVIMWLKGQVRELSMRRRRVARAAD
jgi:uncharacterized iron-regulated membrane protein